MAANVPSRGYTGPTNDLHRDLQRAIGQLNTDVSSATDVSYEAGSVWAGDPPTSLSDAVARIAAVVAANHGAIP